MKYENLYEIGKYALEYEIKLDSDTIQFLQKLYDVSSKEYFILGLDKNIVQNYFLKYRCYKTRDFLLDFSNLSNQELLECMELIGSQNTDEKKDQIYLACRSNIIRNDKEALNLIVSQDTADKQKQVRLACEVEAIRTDRIALNLIASQDRADKQEQIRKACEIEAIRTDKEALNLIASQDRADKQEEMRKACEIEAIRTDRIALNLIASQDRLAKQFQMRKACEVEAIRTDKEALNLIASTVNIDEQCLLISFCRKEKIRNDKELLNLLANCGYRILQETFITYNYVTDNEILKLVASQDSEEKATQIRLACGEQVLRTNIEALRLIASQDTPQKQHQLALEKSYEIRAQKSENTLNTALNKGIDEFVKAYETMPMHSRNLIRGRELK